MDEVSEGSGGTDTTHKKEEEKMSGANRYNRRNDCRVIVKSWKLLCTIICTGYSGMR